MDINGLLHTNPTEFGKRMTVDDLVAVHLTKYFPVGKVVRTLNTVFPDLTLRNTVHWAINHPVNNVAFYGSWDDTTYAVLVPLGKLCSEPDNHVRNFNVVDTYFIGDVRLPRGTTIIVSPTLSQYPFLLEQGIVDYETLMFNFVDTHRCPLRDTPVEHHGLKYIFLNYSCGNLREEVYKEIARQGYTCMPGGMWNWDCDGAGGKDQERIAEQIGAIRTGPHCADTLLQGMEHVSHAVARLLPNEEDGRRIKAFLVARATGISEEHYSRKAYEGLRIFQGATAVYEADYPNFGYLASLEKKEHDIPLDYQRRVAAFVDSIKKALREYIPPVVVQEFGLPL